VAKVRRLAGTRRVGHAGTLDPAATGVLPICIGSATRVVEYLSDAGKAYRASIALGLATASYDLETPPIITLPLHGGGQGGDELAHLSALTIPELEAALRSFVGPQLQTPPMYSALHVGGQRLYELARAGKEVERAARPITIYSLKLLSFAPLTIGDTDYPTLVVEVECSKGTYIRSLAVDIGTRLGALAVLAALTRTRSGPFHLEDAHTLEALTEATQAGRLADLLYPTDYALADLPRVELSPDDERRIRMGQTIPAADSAAEGTLARAYSTDGLFVAILRLQAQRWQPNKVFNLDLTPSSILGEASIKPLPHFGGGKHKIPSPISGEGWGGGFSWRFTPTLPSCRDRRSPSLSAHSMVCIAVISS
jgi:tRNA pseudouridine55 synthase